MTSLRQRVPIYLRLVRLDRPIGSLLLLWPTWWALWLAADGWPDGSLLVIFTAGVLLMRAAGCAINDYADRHVDGHVQRTRNRPLATGEAAPHEALFLFAILSLMAFALVLLTNTLTIQLSFVGLALAACYPFAKRYTHLPQVVLGLAFTWGVPMAFAAQTGTVPPEAWLLFVAAALWPVIYDTFYAMVDREDDLRIGVKSTAILFGNDDRLITGLLQALMLLTLFLVGQRFELGFGYAIALLIAAILFVYQQLLIRNRDRDACFQAFLNNNWVGAALFIGIVLDTWP